MSETHLTKGQKFELNGFKAYHHPFSEAPCRHPCGRSSPSVLVAVSEIQNHKQKNLRGGPLMPLG